MANMKYRFHDGPLANNSFFAVLPSEHLRVHGAHKILQEEFVQRQIGALWLLSLCLPLVDRGRDVPLSGQRLKHLLACSQDDVDYWLADSQPGDRARARDAKDELSSLESKLLRLKTHGVFRDERAAILDYRLRRQNVPTSARRRQVGSRYGIRATAVANAISRGRQKLGLPSLQNR